MNKASSKTDRVNYIDSLRVFLTALVICHHQSIAFGASGGWYYIVSQSGDIVSTVALVIFVAVNQAFFMSLFFFVAAYFSPPSLDSKGMSQFIRDRLIRLGIPLLVFFFLLNPSIMYIVFRFKDAVPSGYFTFMATKGMGFFGWGPLWFVLTLLIFTAVYLAVIFLVRRHAIPQVILPYPNNRQIFIFILTIGGFTFLLRIVNPLGNDLLGLQIAYFPLYIAFFIFGVQAYRSSWLNKLDERQATLWFRVALVLILALPAILVLGGALSGKADAFRGGLTGQSLIYALWEPFLCVGISMKLLVVFRKRLNVVNRLSHLLSKSTYTAYIIHPFFVVVSTHLARNWPLPSVAILLVLCPLVIVACFAVANVLRQLPLLNKVL